jgi:hypothetical protein
LIEMDIAGLDLLPADVGASAFSGFMIACPNSTLGPTADATGANCMTTMYQTYLNSPSYP